MRSHKNGDHIYHSNNNYTCTHVISVNIFFYVHFSLHTTPFGFTTKEEVWLHRKISMSLTITKALLMLTAQTFSWLPCIFFLHRLQRNTPSYPLSLKRSFGYHTFSIHTWVLPYFLWTVWPHDIKKKGYNTSFTQWLTNRSMVHNIHDVALCSVIL